MNQSYLEDHSSARTWYRERPCAARTMDVPLEAPLSPFGSAESWATWAGSRGRVARPWRRKNNRAVSSILLNRVHCSWQGRRGNDRSVVGQEQGPARCSRLFGHLGQALGAGCRVWQPDQPSNLHHEVGRQGRQNVVIIQLVQAGKGGGVGGVQMDCGMVVRPRPVHRQMQKCLFGRTGSGQVFACVGDHCQIVCSEFTQGGVGGGDQFSAAHTGAAVSRCSPG